MNLNTALESLYQEELYNVPSRVIVIVSKPWEDHSEDEKTVLTKMLAAVKLNLALVQIIVREDFTIQQLAAYAPEKVLAFGATLQPSHNTYEHLIIGGVSVIVADGIENLDDVKKKNLWGALRKMFNV